MSEITSRAVPLLFRMHESGTQAVPDRLFADGVTRGTFQEDAAGVAHPNAVGGPAMKADVGREGVGSFENPAGVLSRGRILHDQLDTLVLCQIADDLGINPGNRFELLRPVTFIMGPRQPGCGMR